MQNITTYSGLTKRDNLDTLKKIIQNSLRANTQRTYRNALKNFASWCQKNRCEEINTHNVILYLTELSYNYKISTIKTYFAAIKNLTKDQGINLNTHIIKKFFQGLNNTSQKVTKGAKALDYNYLKQIIKQIDTSTIKGKRDKAIILLGWFGAFRRSELANLNLSDIEETQKGFNVLVRNSKNDKNNQGFYKAIPYNLKDKELCPVLALKDYIKAAQITDGALFRSVKKGDKITQKRLSDNDVYRLIKKIAPDFSAHSLRVGFITSASEKGANPQMIMKQSGHKTIQMVAHYTRSNDVWQSNAVNLFTN
jgi:integrase